MHTICLDLFLNRYNWTGHYPLNVTHYPDLNWQTYYRAVLL